ncbi:MAG TPA: hypothetical protein VM737_00740 [Gemmatimonadota bacterium]|nr:hypothetical protein [Gemmatimonadota bacterium]
MRLPAPLAASLAAVVLIVHPLAAQDIVSPAPQPALAWRSNLLPEELRALPADTLLAYDPWLGVVAPRPSLAPLDGGRLPIVSGIDLLAYTRAAVQTRRSRLWASSVADRLAGRGREEEGLIPELEDPLQIPEPLARVFGEGSQFDIQGKLHMGALGSRSSQDPDLRSQLLQRTVGNFNVDLDQTLDLKILGTVGTKLDVAVDFNSQRELESKQLISAAYTGTEDEILKKVEVGDIRVVLPPSRFLGGAVGRGTFGAQAVAQMGPVDLRILGTRKEGESSERALAIAPRGEGLLSEVTLDIKDTQFVNGRFFLLFHPDSLATGRLSFPNPGTTLAAPGSAPGAGTLNVWVDDGNFTNNRERASKQGTAFVNPTDPAAFPSQSHQGFFDLLVEGEDYVVTDGIVMQLQRQINDSEVLAVSYVTEGGIDVGTPQGAEIQVLKLIKPINPDTLDFTWDYTLRNVYSLRESDIQLSSLELVIYRGNQDLQQTFETISGESRKYSAIFGATDGNGRVNVPRLLRDPFGGPDYLVLPNVRPFFQPTNNAGEPISIERPNRGLYFNSDPRRTPLDDQIYFIQARYLSRGGLTGEIELGAANVIEGSERIAIGGETLNRGEDYQIFYDFGRIVLNDPAGLAERHPNDAISISFEVAPLFNLAPTTLYGASGTYQLGENAVLNSTLMIQDRESLANRPILGAEPTRTVIGEIDGSYVRALPFVTRWLDALPGLDTDEPSSLSLRGEMAWSLPDPNTEGRVFLNDFENIEVAKRLSLFFRTWSFSSVPSQTMMGLTNVGSAAWFTFAIDQRAVTPGVRGVDLGANEFHVRFDPQGETPSERAASWRSIQTVLSTTGEDLTRQEFIEFFVRGDRGTMIVDLGVVDEDQVRLDENGAPVGLGELDTEDQNNDNNFDIDEDTGLDGVAGSDLENVPGDDGNDDFDQSLGPDGFPLNPNGTENNGTLDTEDSNLNGILDRQEDLIRWEVDLSSGRYEVPGSRTTFGYRRIRLPLASPDGRIGTPDLRNTRVLRLAFMGVEERTDFRIVDLEIVGSTFLKRGIVAADGTVLAGAQSDSLRITAINDLENPVYRSPPGVIAEQDRADEVAGIEGLVREQSLELTYLGLPPGARGAIFRPLYDRESYIDYNQMRIWVQGRDVESGTQPDFFVAFGLDTLNVYEYSAPLQNLEWEEHLIDLAVFSELKRALLDSLATADADTGTMISADGRYRVRIASTATPPPTITEVSQLTIGVENTAAAPLTGSFWINEWRLTAPVRTGGAAQYATASATLADFGQVNLTYESRAARYRNLSAARNNFESGDLDVSAALRLEKLLPESWGLAIPLTYDRFERTDAPLFRVGSDIPVTGATERDSIQRTNDLQVLTLRAFRTRESSNPLIAATLDRLEARLTYRKDDFGSVDLDTGRGRWESYFGYRHAFRAIGLPLGMGWIARLPWPGVIKGSDSMQRLSGAELNVVPSNVTMSTQTTFEERSRRKILAGGSDFTADTTRNLAGDAQVEFQPFASMRTSLRWNVTRDLVFPETVVSRGALGTEALRIQTFDFNWSPPLGNWLVPRYSYSSGYNRNHTREASRSLDSLDLRDFGVTTNQNLTFELNVAELLRAFGPDRPTGGGPVQLQTGSAWWERLLAPVRFDRRRRESVSYVQEEQDPGFGFKWGFGEIDEASGEEPQNFARNDDWGLSTGIEPLRGMQIRGGYREIANTRRYLEGANESSTRTWPDVNLRWTNITLPAFLRPVIAGLTLVSDFERRLGGERANDRPLNDTDRRLWDPVAGVTFVWANGMTTDLRANYSETASSAVRGGAVDNRRVDSATDLLLNVDYNIRPGTTLYIPFPTLWGVKLNQPLLTSLTVARRYREDSTRLAGSDESVLNLETVTTEVRPSVAYEFGRVVSGFAVSYLSRVDQKRDITDTTYGLEAFLDFLF